MTATAMLTVDEALTALRRASDAVARLMIERNGVEGALEALDEEAEAWWLIADVDDSGLLLVQAEQARLTDRLSELDAEITEAVRGEYAASDRLVELEG